jgi:hypothetical protein
MLTVLGRKMGLIRPSGVFEIFPPNTEEEWCTLGGPSLVLTERGVEELFWPDDLPRADKRAEGENQVGAA